VQVLQLFSLGELAQPLLFELRKDREKEEDQEQTKRVFHLVE
tara:strand:+ start:399 stop:524 length:126 start_codon:yes stop_codon:yes gene_type:complete